MSDPMITRPPLKRDYELSLLLLGRPLRTLVDVLGAKACCSNPKPQLMYDTIAKKRVLQCLNCGCFVG